MGPITLSEHVPPPSPTLLPVVAPVDEAREEAHTLVDALPPSYLDYVVKQLRYFLQLAAPLSLVSLTPLLF